MHDRFDFREWSTELSRVPITRFGNPSKRTVIAVGNALRQYTRADGTNAHPGVDALAEGTGLSRPTVRKALDWLVDFRWIRRRPRSGRLADVFDLLPPEIPLANGPVDLADFPPEGADEAVDADLARLSELWKSTDVVGNPVSGNFAGNSGPLVGKPVAHKPPFVGKPVSPKNETIEITTSSPKGEPPGARTRAHAREAPPDGLAASGELDRWGNPRYLDRFGNRLASDAEIADAYRRRHVAGVDPRALDHVRQVRAERGWRPGPAAAPPDVAPPWADPEFDPFDAPPNPDNVEWLDDGRTNVASGVPIRTHKGAGSPKTESPDSRDVPKPVEPEDNGCTQTPEANPPDGEPF